MAREVAFVITPQVKALAEASGAYARATRKRPLFLPPSLYDALAAGGTDMKDIARQEPMS